jgi:hypothetical protein
MRLASTLLLAVLLSCLSTQAYAVEPGVIAVPSMSTPNMDMPKPLITRPNMDAPVPNPKPPIGPNNNQNQATNKTVNATSNQTQVTKIQQEVKPIDVSGKWSIRFDDRTDIVLDLTLWSSGGSKIMGYGTLTEKGAKNSMTASGSFAAPELKLTAKSAAHELADQRFNEYYLDMLMANNTLSGTYVLELSGQSQGNGNVTAVRL